ncbi:hypothetical protein ACFL6I_25005 [candidate division KSB1 bacterium]
MRIIPIGEVTKRLLARPTEELEGVDPDAVLPIVSDDEEGVPVVIKFGGRTGDPPDIPSDDDDGIRELLFD